MLRCKFLEKGCHLFRGKVWVRESIGNIERWQCWAIGVQCQDVKSANPNDTLHGIYLARCHDGMNDSQEAIADRRIRRADQSIKLVDEYNHELAISEHGLSSSIAFSGQEFPKFVPSQADMDKIPRSSNIGYTCINMERALRTKVVA